ncbi:hypothetical protein [Bacillus sp. PK3_68]|uniref:hypothetical protein n=1 Tax=Bacillus sp. PK3_68 TaxID=2027408 RepID=UPI000E732400|nr:hypothetical protein [Bacillus sp. PK3_68]RJS59242.1 hypothetical protein CJ483_03480 [Bacillus sp. PK3_68]
MAEVYKLIYPFKNEDGLEEDTHNIVLSAEQIAFILNERHQPPKCNQRNNRGNVSETKIIEHRFPLKEPS